VKVGTEISLRSKEITSKIIKVATVSKRTKRFSLPKALFSVALVGGVLLMPFQISWGMAQAATTYDSVQTAQMWKLVKAVQSGQDTDPVHIAQAQEFLSSSYASNPPGWYVPTGATQSTAIAPSSATLEVWWPTNGASLQGTQPFKALAQGKDINTYTMFWQVDGGSLHAMPTNTADYPHKEDSAVDVNAFGGGSHTLTFVAKDLANNTLGSLNVSITVASTQVSQTQPVPQTTSVTNTSATISSSGFYVDPYSPAARQATEWRSYRPGDASKMDILAAEPTAKWFGNWSGNVESAVREYVNAAKAAGKTPVLVAYNVPQRDCGGYSAGGASDYTNWIGAFARGIGSANAVVILEPDSLSLMDCLSSGDQDNRYKLLSGAVSILKSNGNTSVYLDAGHSNWIDPSVMAARLQKANVAQASGFALNVSNFMTTGDETSYGTQVSAKIGGKHFVIDTGRNGNGSNGEWCNPWGRAIGMKPTTNTGNSLVDAYLWVKTPGESDGNCNGGPSAGNWWADYALSLVR
jgi:endoglucanase